MTHRILGAVVNALTDIAAHLPGRRRRGIAAQQAGHPHPSSFDRHVDDAIGVTRIATCHHCNATQQRRPIYGMGVSGPSTAETTHYGWDCGACGQPNYFRLSPMPTIPRRGK